ncbi:ssDNA endodeoxyribonuclease [Datura stramonium]|uniref:SsDNA endodeoxyribonuclease n=1 Tax=Datura stramonium TaxID=4076 RepID=A0ABS8T0Z8_DATST|nr:ssDNA endodeoxyribonuclease [Datura stramonium]
MIHDMANVFLSLEPCSGDQIGYDPLENGLYLSHHKELSYSLNPYTSVLKRNAASMMISSLSSGSGDFKRLRGNTGLGESLGSSSSFYTTDSSGSGGSNCCTIPRNGSTNSVNSLSLPQGLHFRDHVWALNQRYLAAEAIEEAAADIIYQDEENGEGMKLVQLLITCAEAVACRDKSRASVLLSELRASALVFGTSFQRVASCFMQGLADRLALVQPLGTVGYVATPAMSKTDIALEKKEEALRLLYEICPHIQFGHFVANCSILEAFEGESFVHVVDLGMSLGLPHGQQWRRLIQSLANRHGQPPRRLRITAVGQNIEKFQIIGDELEAYARSLGINLEFSAVESNLENLKPKDIKVYDGEVIHELSPKILVLVEQDSSHNGPFFLGRFMEALHYYSAIFDSLDVMLPKYDTKRAKIEQFYFAEEIKNIVSCEGPARVERHERVDQWRRRMSRAGFQAAPIKMVSQAKQWLAKVNAYEGFTITEEKGCLVLGWKSKPIVAASCWKC